MTNNANNLKRPFLRKIVFIERSRFARNRKLWILNNFKLKLHSYEKKKNVGISIFAAVVMTVGLVFGGHTSFEAQAVKTCDYARCHVDINKCLPGNAISTRPRCSTIVCMHALACDPFTVTIE